MMKGMRRIKGLSLILLFIAAAIFPLACATRGRQDNGQSDRSYKERGVSPLTESNFEREKAQASNSGW
jgi:hypothetical protein